MIILFEENETLFQSLGLGSLKDAKSCIVKEGLNDTFELEMQYPITGQNFSKIALNRIIFAKSNPYSEAQPYRIDSISKPINGVIVVKAVHISYDMNGIPVKPISGGTPSDVLDKIQNSSLIEHNFKFYTDITTSKSFKTTNYYNMRALLMGSDESFLETYKGEILFDKFNVRILQRRGSNKGASVRYAKNMKDITHEVNYERLYNGVYPFYHKEEVEATTDTTSDGFKQVYIVGTKPYQDGWFSYTPDGEPYHPIDESPVQVASDGDYKDKVYTWNTTTQRYSERAYNEMVNLIDYVTDVIKPSDKPKWVYIDASGLPNLVVKAAVDGYFKLATDTDWSKKLKGEVVFQGSILNASDGLIMYFAEVIPVSETSTETETVNMTHVELDDKIIWLKTDAALDMKYNRILCLDLTQSFDDVPDQDKLLAKANEYIEENKIGQYKYDTKVSFIDLSSTTDGTIYEKMETVELGDTVRVVYEGMGVDVELRVISTTYNVLTDRYDEIELGEKTEKLSANSVQTGDNISSLTNDTGYTDVTTVNKLIAKTVTADLIQAKNAKLSKAQIEELQAARIKITGMIEATQFELDTLVAKMLTADNAVIKQTLEAGTVKVKGDITITKGEISIISGEEGDQKVFHVDRDGNLTANAVSITGGELNINDTFRVTPDGVLYAQGASISGDIEIVSGSITLGSYFEVTPEGIIKANAGTIAGFTISKDLVNAVEVGRIRYGIQSIDDILHDGVYIGTDGVRLGSDFLVTPDGTLHAQNVIISGEIEATTGSIAGFDILSDAIQKGTTGNRVIVSPGRSMTLFNVTKDWSFVAGAEFNTLYDVDTYTDAKFAVSKDGYVYASALNLRGGSIQIQNSSLNTSFSVNEMGQVSANAIHITGGNIVMSSGGNVMFSVDTNGHVEAKDMNITGGSIVIRNELDGVQFRVTDTGEVTCKNIHIIGGEISLGNPPSYHLDRITDINVIYTVVENVTSVESGDYKSVLYNMDLSSLEEDILPEDCGNLSAGTRVPKFRVEYFETEGEYPDPDGYDYYWYVGTITYDGVIYDRWVKVEDPYYGNQSFNTDERTFIYCTQVVQQDSRTGAYFYVDSQGNLTATSAKINGEINTIKGYIGGFTITESSIQNGYDDEDRSQGIYLGSDCIRIGDRIDKSFISKSIRIDTSIIGSNGCVDIITDSNNVTHDENYANSVFILYYSRSARSDIEVTVVACDSNYNPLPPSKEWSNTFTLKAGTTSFELELCNSQYFRFFTTSRSISSAHLELKICPGFTVNNLGELYCVNATVKGTIISTNGNIGGFAIDNNSIRLGTLGSDGSVWMCAGSSTYANIAGSGNTNGWTFAAGSKFGVKTDGTIYAASSNFKNVNIDGGTIKVSSSYSSVTLGNSSYNTYGILCDMSGNAGKLQIGWDGGSGYYDSTNPTGQGIFSLSSSPFVIKYTYQNYSGSATDYRSFIMMRHSQFDNAPQSQHYYGFKTGIRIYQKCPSNNTYGPSYNCDTDIRINWLEKLAESGAQITGYPKDVYNASGTFRNNSGNALLVAEGYADYNGAWDNDYPKFCLACYCGRFWVSGDGWQKVDKPFDSVEQIKAILTGREDSSLGGYNYPALYKIVAENGKQYVYIGNDGGETSIDVLIIYEVGY